MILEIDSPRRRRIRLEICRFIKEKRKSFIVYVLSLVILLGGITLVIDFDWASVIVLLVVLTTSINLYEVYLKEFS